jgi:hypothetical protein
MEIIQLLGTAMGLGFVSGVNLYATVLAVGLGVNFGLIHLSPHLAGLEALGHPLVVVVAGVLYTVEFFADKVPWVDTAWDSIHTFIRPIGAAWIAATALGTVDPVLDVATVLLAGGVAFSSHATKAGMRVLVNASPEPFSNVALSLAEDMAVVGGTWLVLRYPIVTGLAAAFFAVMFVVFAPRLLSILRAHLRAVAALLRTWRGRERAVDDRVDDLPAAYASALPPDFGRDDDFALRCVTGRRLGVPAGQTGYLCRTAGRLVLLVRRHLQVREHEIDLAQVHEVRVQPGVLFDGLSLRAGARTTTLYFFRDRRRTVVDLACRLDAMRDVVPLAANARSRHSPEA